MILCFIKLYTLYFYILYIAELSDECYARNLKLQQQKKCVPSYFFIYTNCSTASAGCPGLSGVKKTGKKEFLIRKKGGKKEFWGQKRRKKWGIRQKDIHFYL